MGERTDGRQEAGWTPGKWVAGAALAAATAGISLAAAAPALRPPDPCAQNPVGRRVLESFCLSCHTLDDARENPLRPKLDARRFGTQQAAYDSIGRLEQMNAAMILEFSGTEEERKALASCLTSLAKR